jgi:putative endonuclease
MDRSEASRRRGAAGETIAAAFLEARGYTVAARNVRLARGELDLVARRGETWVAVEVKWRPAGEAFGGGGGAWRPAQRARQAAAVAALRATLDPEGQCAWRFDLIVLEEGARGLTLTHYRGAWTPGGAAW